MDLRHLIGILWRRKLLLIQAFVVITITAAGLTMMMSPTYEAACKVLIQSTDTTDALLSSIGLEEMSSMAGFGTDTEQKSDIEICMSHSNLDYVIERLQLQSKGGSRLTPDVFKTSSILTIVFPRPTVNVEEIEDTDILEITATASDPDEAAAIPNALAEVFIGQKLDSRRAEYRSAREFIDGQIQLVRAEYDRELERYRQYQLEQKTVDLSTETRIAIEKMGELMKEKEDNIIDIEEAKARIKTVKAQLADQSADAVHGGVIRDNPHIEKIKNNLGELKMSLARALQEYTTEHPEVRSLQNQIKALTSELESELSVVKSSSSDLEELERNLAALEVHLEAVNADIEKYTKLLFTIPDKSLMASKLKLDLSTVQEVYTSLLEYRYEIGVAEALTLSEASVVEAAVSPALDDPEMPSMPINTIVGAFLGLMFGFLLVFMAEYFDDTVKTPMDLRHSGDFKLAGVIPVLKKTDIITPASSRPNLLDAFRRIRSSIQFASIDKNIQTLIVTSCVEGEGKTLVCSNLAASFAHMGKKVLIVDVDLRKPAIHNRFKLSPSPGLTTLLLDSGDEDTAITHIDDLNIDVLPCGPLPPDPGGVLESTKFAQQIDSLRNSYDVILLDAAPVFAGGDALILSPVADGILIVSECGRVLRRQLLQVKEQLTPCKEKVVGCVLNRMQASSHGYYGYGYGYGLGRYGTTT